MNSEMTSLEKHPKAHRVARSILSRLHPESEYLGFRRTGGPYYLESNLHATIFLLGPESGPIELDQRDSYLVNKAWSDDGLDLFIKSCQEISKIAESMKRKNMT